MKEIFEEAKLKLIVLGLNDVITSSGDPDEGGIETGENEEEE